MIGRVLMLSWIMAGGNKHTSAYTVGIAGSGFNLVIWQWSKKLPNIKFVNIYTYGNSAMVVLE